MLSDALKTLRLQYEMTQQMVANVLNIDRTTYTYYELGRTKPDFTTLCRIARLYKITLDDIERLADGADEKDAEDEDDGMIRVADEEIGLEDFFGDRARGFYTLSQDEKDLLFLYRACENKRQVLEMIKEISRKGK